MFLIRSPLYRNRQTTRQCTASLGRTSILSYIAHFWLWFWLWDHPPSSLSLSLSLSLCRAAAGSRWPRPFAPLHFPLYLRFFSFSLLSLSMAFLWAELNLLTHMAPLAPLTNLSLSLSLSLSLTSTVSLVLHLFLSFALFLLFYFYLFLYFLF